MIDIKLEHVVKKYGNDVIAVDDLSLDFEQGSFVCLLGPSGCGKTTTLRMISGLERANDGIISIGGEVFDSPKQTIFVRPEHRSLGLVFQSYALWPHMTVQENVEFGLKMKKVSKEERERIIAESLDLLRMSVYCKRYPAELSGGQQQRVALARMLAVQPNILLLDEPLSNLDAALRLEMRSELKSLHERLGSTIVFVTHDQLEAMSLATHVAVMNEGKLEQYADPMTIYLKPATEFVATFVGSPPMNMVNFAISEEQPWKQSFRKTVASYRSLQEHDQRICKVGFRPETVTLYSPATEKQMKKDQTCIKGRVKAVLPTGPEQIVSVVVDDEQFYVVTPPTISFENGEAICMGINLDSIHIFDQNGLRV
ncbi:ABC transporter ATP-binding protein [Sphaerochaeta sp. S2]|uniref:ABC transporter ATP-binding protein n=1 Tax=Sphaerochaeta sp. S2 TaxID=2798868 RepID=UPI0018E9EA7C|nr:ABC transporter ATP-binding protein [Sphaerochaeta sp. S2]MBJ2357827.1 ABC transporter ATP-binding protein [Sphaerochaeta sp. S2]